MYRLFQPNGYPVNVYYKHGEDKSDILEKVFIPKWEQFCNDNWLNGKSKGFSLTAEDRVKRFLDSCAWFLLRSDSTDLISEWDNAVDVQRYIPMSSCPDAVADYFYSSETPPMQEMDMEPFEMLLERLDEKADAKKKSKVPSLHGRKPMRQRQIQQIREKYPNASFTYCRVDTENFYCYKGKSYYLDDERYSPVQTGYGLYYAMDTVLIVECADGRMGYYTQSLEEILPK